MQEPNRRVKPRILFFAPILEYPPAGGPQISVMNAIKVLHQISELHIVTTVSPTQLGSPDAQNVLQQYCHKLVHAPSSRLHTRNRIVAKIVRKFRRLAAPLLATADVAFLMKYATQNSIEIFWIDRVLEHAFAVFRQLRGRLPQARIVGDTEAVYSRFILRELPLVRNPLKRIWISLTGRKKVKEEMELAAHADVITAVSEVDAEYFRSLAADAERVRLFSNVVDLDNYTTPVEPSLQVHRPCFLLLGSYGRQGSPMDRAARWVVSEVMPKVWQKVPETHLYIIGRNANFTQSSLASRHVSVIGQIPSVLGYLQQAAATLVPLRYESGTRFKIIESGAAAVPCISTTLGAEGLAVEHEKSILIADAAEEFAEAMVRMLTEPELAATLARNLHALVEQNYSLAVQEEEGRKIIEYVGNHHHE